MMENMEADSPYPVTPAHIGKNFILKLSADDAREITLGCTTDGRTQVSVVIVLYQGLFKIFFFSKLLIL